MITIRHSHADGTILYGSRKGDGVYEIVKDNGGFTWRPVPGIFIRGSRDKDAQEWRINAAAEALRAAGHEVRIEIDNAWRPSAEREADLTERAEDRAAHLRSRAHAAAGRWDARWEAARRELDHIPPGQPMLVDHYSYAADRNRRERAWRNQDRAMEEYRFANRLGTRAGGVESNQRYRHNPRVTMRRVERLEAELRGWQRTHAATCADDRPRVQREIDRLTEEINYWRGQLAEAEATGAFVWWEPEHFRKGDQVRVLGSWHTVRRINRKSVSVPWIVGTMASGRESEHTDTVPWDKISGRRRDGMQLDRPNGQPWPVELAERINRWRDLLAEAYHSDRRGDCSTGAIMQRLFVKRAQLHVHGLPKDADEKALKAAQAATDAQGIEVAREMVSRCLIEYERLTAAERVD